MQLLWIWMDGFNRQSSVQSVLDDTQDELLWNVKPFLILCLLQKTFKFSLVQKA